MVRGVRPMGGKGRDEGRGKEKPGERGGGKRSLRRGEREREERHGVEEGQHEAESLFHSVGSAS